MKGKIIFVLSSIIISILTINVLLLTIMATSKKGFRYNEITITSISDSKEYDGEKFKNETVNITKGKLYNGDHIEASFSSEIVNYGTVVNFYTVKILNKDNNDVTSEYNITYEYGTLEVLKREVTLKLVDEVIPYDGSEYFLTNYEAVDGSLITDDIVSITNTKGLKDVGSLRTSFVAHVYRNGVDISNNYTITSLDGTITRTARDITIKSMDDDKLYDGTPLIKHEYDLTGDLVSGDEIIMNYTGTITDAGATKNTYTYQIVDSQGDDVSSCYNITEQAGNLIVNPIVLTFKSENVYQEYSGKPVTVDVSKIQRSGAPLKGHKVKISPTASLTNVGSTYGDFDVIVTDESNPDKIIDVTKNYYIEKNEFTITVAQKVLNIKTYGDTKTYDGKKLSVDLYDFNEDDIIQGQTINISLNNTPIEVGYYKNSALVVIKDALGNNVTYNYKVVVDEGDLVINPINITLLTGSASKTFDNEPLRYESSQIIYGSLLTGHYLDIEYLNEITDAGTIDNVCKVKIVDSKGKEIDDKIYNIDIKYGFLTVIDQRDIIYIAPKDVYTLTTDDSTDEITPTEIIGFEHYTNQGYTYDVTFTDESKVVGKGKAISNIETIEIYNQLGYKVTNEFEIKTYPGVVCAYLDEITITTKSDTKVYDGTALQANELEVTEGYSVECVYTSKITNVGKRNNSIVVQKIIKGDTELDLAYVKINYVYGTLEVTRKEITCTTGSKKASIRDEKYGIICEEATFDYLEENATYEVIDAQILTTIKTIQNVFEVKIINENKEDVTLNYKITYVYGNLELTE